MNSQTNSKVLYANLDTTFVNLWALLRSLSQRGFIGRVHVELKDYSADVFMTGSNTPLVHEIDRAAGTETLEEAALHRLVLRTRATSGLITVYEGLDEAVAVKNQHEPSLTPDPASLSAPDNSWSESSSGPAISVQPDPGELRSTPQVDPLPDVADERPQFSASPSPEPNRPSLQNQDDQSMMTPTSAELIAGVERALNGSGADFRKTFAAARLELADDYPFLDPLSRGFNYEDGTVTINTEIATATYVSGLSEALRRTVNQIATGDRARRIRERVALELFSVARRRRDVLEQTGFLAQLDRIAGTKVL